MNAPTLCPLQSACLLWLSRGKTIKEIADVEGQSVAVIERCIAGAMALLGVDNIEDAVRITERSRLN
ncbi:hypothetical protein [Rhizobium etli]|uniref:hypothetical protein n=1 Tax=Rhizobium etli TaxID=29449 RepID=UPI000383A09A|nr:hypothetical protein [Rhizobium etli]AGS24554.1 helix-turn-helix domain-containing protein [Rhizobium etli bv. mimosae str. Mim1]